MILGLFYYVTNGLQDQRLFEVGLYPNLVNHVISLDSLFIAFKIYNYMYGIIKKIAFLICEAN